MTAAFCFICGGKDFEKLTEAYQRCRQCWHETLVEGGGQSFMLNDPLSKVDAVRSSVLDRFKNNVLERFDPDPPNTALWVDVGSASGKYLFQNLHRYNKAIGLEVTPSAIKFSREVLGLNILEDAIMLPERFHIITAWHSLEHFPADALDRTLDTLAKKLPRGAIFIVSVPNSNSIQYKWFRSSYAFFDVPSHLHQFSPVSLDILLGRHGFNRLRLIMSWPYNIFGYIQGLLNIMTGTHNYLYFRIKRKSAKSSWWWDVINGCLLPIAVPFGLVMGLMDAIRPEQQGVITVCYKKSH